MQFKSTTYSRASITPFYLADGIFKICDFLKNIYFTAQNLPLPESFKGSRKAHYGHESANTVLSSLFLLHF